MKYILKHVGKLDKTLKKYDRMKRKYRDLKGRFAELEFQLIESYTEINRLRELLRKLPSSIGINERDIDPKKGGENNETRPSGHIMQGSSEEKRLQGSSSDHGGS